MKASTFHNLTKGRPPALDTIPVDLPTSVPQLLQELVNFSLIRSRYWDDLSAATRASLGRLPDEDALLNRLVELELLTPYQVDRLRAGTVFGMILGNYRVLDRLGAGAMGVVFKGEHLRLPKMVAIKVLPMYADQDPRFLQRFLAEIGAVSQLNHPNIVTAVDAGEVVSEDLTSPNLHYFVMDFVEGEDLESKVQNQGPLPVLTACRLMYQVASALEEAHKHNLVHRDIKPSNILITPGGLAKLLDFGLARRYESRMTEPGIMLGTLDFVAPEQARDASSVDIRADIYGLGATLYWCLTGQLPYPTEGNVVRDLLNALNMPPPSVQASRPEVPAELDAVVARMMAQDPGNRYPTPQAAMQALLPFIKR